MRWRKTIFPKQSAVPGEGAGEGVLNSWLGAMGGSTTGGKSLEAGGAKIPLMPFLVLIGLLLLFLVILTFTLVPPDRKRSFAYLMSSENRIANPFIISKINGLAITLPYFLILGAPKCGTTSLFHYLAQHPQVVLPREKELKFFGREKQTLEWYGAQFPPLPQWSGDVRITGEATPTYLQGKGDLSTAKRAFGIVPNAKLIVMLRDPVEAAISYWAYVRRMNWAENRWKNVSLENAVELSLKELQLCQSGLHPTVNISTPEEGPNACFSNKLGHNLLTFSSYVHGIRRWLAVYPREQFHFIELSEFSADLQEGMRNVGAFLKIANHTYSPTDLSKVFNRNELDLLTDQVPLTEDEIISGSNLPQAERAQRLEQIKELLREFFHPFNVQLYQLLGTDYHWPTPSSTSKLSVTSR